MIKLRLAINSKFVYINVDHIIQITQLTSSTEILLSNSDHIIVDERAGDVSSLIDSVYHFRYSAVRT